ncbi:hypothetical protein OG735_31835 [Streptomyces sp. NBC_01210]|uniref:hypothetical protein n=1 Tax=Streptomyces sp. NBC_01210 TaxID=2903774 RepID=UPI002E116F66|nr:hypothetical protein OG735_31835 [Streptomyces sp. NBC_01210]
MTDAMLDALFLSGILITIVLTTQVGRHRFGVLKLLMPLGLVAYFAYDMLHNLKATQPNLTSAGVGIAIGAAIGVGLLYTMRVENDAATGKTYTRAGWSYLAIWMAVLVGRLSFIWSLENIDSFRADFGKWTVEQQIDPDGVAAFFVLMAMAMVLVRTVGVAIRWMRRPRHVAPAQRTRQPSAV